MSNTVLYQGENCLLRNTGALKLGKRCLIVTGATSAVRSGALPDVTKALAGLSVDFIVYNGVTENPTMQSCRDAGRRAYDYHADFVIGIGGGSALDAAKAAALFARNPDITDEELFSPDTLPEALPIAAVPLTAGTGSEVNCSSVITTEGRKRSFVKKTVLPVCAFLDPRYLKTLNPEYTVSTAIDAFCHCFESYLSPKSTPESERDALCGGRLIWEALTANSFMPDGEDAAGLSPETRLSMLQAASMGGRALMVTGTGFTHPLGYGITLEYNIPHGRACGCFVGKYVEYNMETEEGRRRITAFADHIGTTPDILAAVIPALSDVNLMLSKTMIEAMIGKISNAKNFRNSPRVITDDDAADILIGLFGAGDGENGETLRFPV